MDFFLVDYCDIRTLFIFSISFLLVYIYIQSRDKGSRLPPGPPALPIIGSLPYLGIDSREPLRQMTQKYGDVFTVYLGSKPAVILNSYDAIKEAFVKNAHAFSGRPQDMFFIKDVMEGMGVAASQGDVWREQRKFAHGILREFGVGKSLIEDRIHEEINHLMSNLESHIGRPLDMTHILINTVANIICSIVLGQRYDFEDRFFKELVRIVNDVVGSAGSSGLLTIFPFLKYMPGDFFGYYYTIERVAFLKTAFRGIVEKHHATYDPQISRDFIDAYVGQMEKEKVLANKSSFNDEQLIINIFTLFGAGTETTSSSLRWMIIYMLHHPDVQSKVQQEIDDVIGCHRLPRMQDRIQMPYTEATLLEIQRMADILPLGVPHSTTEDVQFRGCLLPKGTIVLSNLNAVNRDPNLWKEPYKFNPGHFQTSDGKLDKKEISIPFSMGKRVCLGESLARAELFLLYTAILQRFSFQLPEGCPLPPMTGKPGITSPPYDCEVVLVART